jgi:hypothetical protein
MKAQAYVDDPHHMIVRIFPVRGNYGIADLPLTAATPAAADHALRQIRLRRRTRWEQTSYGREASVRFVSSNDTLHGSSGAKRKEIP